MRDVTACTVCSGVPIRVRSMHSYPQRVISTDEVRAQCRDALDGLRQAFDTLLGPDALAPRLAPGTDRAVAVSTPSSRHYTPVSVSSPRARSPRRVAKAQRYQSDAALTFARP